MNKREKEQVVQSLRTAFADSQASFLVNYKGLSVNQMQELRGELRSNGGRLQVAKARLMKRATQGIDCLDSLDDYLKDQIAVVFTESQAPNVAKALHAFSKKNESLELVVGCLDSTFLQANDIVRIGSLPSREILLAQVCGTLNAPIGKLAFLLNMMVVRLLFVLKQIEDKKKQS